MSEGFVEIGGEGFYVIPEVDRLGAFLMSIVSGSDHWMFVSSRGGLTAGRRTPASALFAYETEDRLHRANGLTGPITIIRSVEAGRNSLWEPFRDSVPNRGKRNLFKSVVGDKIIFEETHDELGLVFRYRWSHSDRFGFIRTSTIVNASDRSATLDVLDGLLDILPPGLDPPLYQEKSILTHAYMRSEIIDPVTRLGVYTLEALVSDRPEPAEALLASVAWSAGFEEALVGTNRDMVEAFRSGRPVLPARLLTGQPGAYLLSGSLELDAGQETSWTIAADVENDQRQVVALRRFLGSSSDPAVPVAESVRAGTDALVALMARSDALQRTGDRTASAHHFTNVTFNSMRGGIFTEIRKRDLIDYLDTHNREVAELHSPFLAALPEVVDRTGLLREVEAINDSQLMRLVLAYLPLGFSRRHGDPSRPWNDFAIRVRDDEGRMAICYQGNWRDIFQNWEALALSFPEYLTSMVAVFVNASTPDGFNPYRLTQDGIDWEVPDPDDPWSNIGYWGDHQIVYLLRLVEATNRFLPGALARMLDKAWFSYADVPYRIAPYEQMVSDPRNTIHYDLDAAKRTEERVATVGADGRLLRGQDGTVHLASLLEKLLVPALSKLSNYVPTGGIWMNTQRPEWNDGNNALVGYGLSMVTLYHLRRYLDTLAKLTRECESSEVLMSTEVAEWLAAVTAVFRGNADAAASSDDSHRRQVVDQLGAAFATYRSRVYDAGFSGSIPVRLEAIADLCSAAMPQIDKTIVSNRRSDGLYHSYNLVRFHEQSASVEHMYEMLEGQVAVLGAGLLTPEEQADVLEALFSSAMYRSDQRSFTLYPARHLPSFLDKNVVAPEDVIDNPLLASLIEAGDSSVVVVDDDGRYRFNSEFTMAGDLEAALTSLCDDSKWKVLVAENRAAVLEAYETVFRHHSFTGRSGTMYSYEGIGSIFWHMVGKLLVAVQNAVVEAKMAGASSEVVARLSDAYWRVRSGLGFNKTAIEYGAFPTDPYSHTPAHAGAKQPGMTGEAKEELLTRLLEGGIRVENGEIVFDPVLLRTSEFVETREQWPVIDLAGERQVIELPGGSLGITLCQVPVLVVLTSEEPAVEILYADTTRKKIGGLRLGLETSRSVFSRTGKVAQITAYVPRSVVRKGPTAAAGPRRD